MDFDSFVQMHERYMMTVAMNILNNYHDAEDALCEAFASVVPDFAKIMCYSETKQRDIMLSITKETAAGILKKRSSVAEHEMLVPDYDDIECDVALAYMIDECGDEVSFPCLSSKDNMLLTMHFLDGLSITNISRMTGMRRDKVCKRIRKAIALLKENTSFRDVGGSNQC